MVLATPYLIFLQNRGLYLRSWYFGNLIRLVNYFLHGVSIAILR
nr:MAG TPA: hypothetical protein [Caudoviricetes sp.]